jgi:hypothetical protein
MQIGLFAPPRPAILVAGLPRSTRGWPRPSCPDRETEFEPSFVPHPDSQTTRRSLCKPSETSGGTHGIADEGDAKDFAQRNEFCLLTQILRSAIVKKQRFRVSQERAERC